MKRVILNKDITTTELSNVVDTKVYCYVTSNGRLMYLRKLGNSFHKDGYRYHYAFVNLSESKASPVFHDLLHYLSVSKALSSGAQVLEFNNFNDMIHWKFKIESKNK